MLNEIVRRRVPEVAAVVLRTYGAIFVTVVGFGVASLIDPLIWRAILLLILIGYVLVRGWPIINTMLFSKH
jgi:uncharacterized membrane protein YccC